MKLMSKLLFLGVPSDNEENTYDTIVISEDEEFKIEWLHGYMRFENHAFWLNHVALNIPKFSRWFQFQVIHNTPGPKHSIWCQNDPVVLSQPSELIIDMKQTPPLTDDEKEFYGEFRERILHYIMMFKFHANRMNLKRIVVVGADAEPFNINGLHICALFLSLNISEQKHQLHELHVECQDLHLYAGKQILEEFLSQQTTLKKLHLKVKGAIVNRFLGNVSKKLLNNVSLDVLAIQSKNITIRGLSKILAGRNTKRVKHLILHMLFSNRSIEEISKLLRHPCCTNLTLNVMNLEPDGTLVDISNSMKDVLITSMKANGNGVKLNGVNIYSD